MTLELRKGVTVRQIMPAPYEGEVSGFRADDETGEVLAIVKRWIKDDAGIDHLDERAFKKSDLEVIPTPVDPQA
jgi:hypothetical protein